nr:hypothetical protein Iba_scaffold21410CG0040 [Ipomoea batatas]
MAVNFVDCGGGGVESAEEVIGAPADEVPDVIIFSGGLKLVLVLNHTPAQHRHRERHRKMELSVVSGVVVASDQPSLDVRQFGSVVQPGIPSPRVGEGEGVRTFLSVEEEEGLVEGNGVIIRRRGAGVALGQRYGDDSGQGEYEEGDDDSP